MILYSWEPEKIMKEIQAKRKLMIDSAKKTGLTSECTVRHSQELDQLIVAYQKYRYSARRQTFRRLNSELKHCSPGKIKSSIFNGTAAVQAGI
ncbi:aspartyl-phosphate phosphatase Spo0E family protein [Bacillus sp. B-jedd]|uniref:aspartyl-phosphate phosphatase Spo0E family protein n=1 Tax=Bacillus sp. B-jedd TaxID=1476857 RepID=UPI0005156E2D|nr:aspartyl-phosphate phosphatase Spo0E family protein [Bacillus sp. B-jedd]CEG26609.1 negative regulatory phosphatase [Bacillus sp. B-jedd]